MAGSPAPARILIIDDEPLIGVIVQRALRTLDVSACTDAHEALAAIRGGRRYDVILCDLMMPAMTGMAFYATLQAECPEQAAAVMFLTGGASSPETAAFLGSVRNPQMVKPFDVERLRQQVQTFLTTRVTPQ